MVPQIDDQDFRFRFRFALYAVALYAVALYEIVYFGKDIILSVLFVELVLHFAPVRDFTATLFFEYFFRYAPEKLSDVRAAVMFEP